MPPPKKEQKKQTFSLLLFRSICFTLVFYMERCNLPVTFQAPGKPHGWTWGSDRCVAPYALALAFIDWSQDIPRERFVHITPG